MAGSEDAACINFDCARAKAAAIEPPATNSLLEIQLMSISCKMRVFQPDQHTGSSIRGLVFWPYGILRAEWRTGITHRARNVGHRGLRVGHSQRTGRHRH